MSANETSFGQFRDAQTWINAPVMRTGFFNHLGDVVCNNYTDIKWFFSCVNLSNDASFITRYIIIITSFCNDLGDVVRNNYTVIK